MDKRVKRRRRKIPFPSLGHIHDLRHHANQKAFYIVFDSISRYTKIGITRNMHRRMTEYYGYTQGMCLVAFYVTELASDIERHFKIDNKSLKVSGEIFDISPLEIVDWVERNYLLTPITPSPDDAMVNVLRCRFIQMRMLGFNHSFNTFMEDHAENIIEECAKRLSTSPANDTLPNQ